MTWHGKIEYGSDLAPYGGSWSLPNFWWVPPAYPSSPPAPLGSGTTKSANNVAQLNALLPNLNPGDVVVLAPGTYENPNTQGSLGDSPTSSMPTFAGTESAPIIFYSSTLHGAVFTRTDNRVVVKTSPSHNHIEFWGVDLVGSTSRPGFGSFGGTGIYLKWSKVFSQQNQPTARWLETTDFGAYFSYVRNASNETNAEGIYVGWGTDASLYEQNGCRLIGNILEDSPGGAMDIKPNTFDFLAEFNVIDGHDDISGAVNLNNAWRQLNATQRAKTDPDDFIFRRNIVRVERKPGGSNNGDAIRTSGQCWLDRNIFIAGNGTVQDAVFFFNDGDQNVTVKATGNRAYGFPNNFIGSGGSNGNIVGSDNYSNTSMNSGLGTVNNASAYVGPTSGLYVNDTAGLNGGMGTGMRFNGLQGWQLPGEPPITSTAAAFEIDGTLDGAVDVTTPLALSGSAPAGSQNLQFRINNGASTIVDYGDVPVTQTGETWTADQTVAIPQGGETITVDARRRDT